MADKTFYEEDTELVLESFKTFDFANTASWSEIELWATINSVDIDMKFVSTFLTGTILFKSLFNAFMSCLSENNFIDKYANTIEFVETLFKVYQPFKFQPASPVVCFEKWLANNDKVPDTDFFFRNTMTANKYSLLNVLDRKFPFLLIKFYNKRKFDLHGADMEFVKWLLAGFKAKAKNGDVFKKIYDALSNEVRDQNSIVRFMN